MSHYFITGTSSGIGAALAGALCRDGHKVSGMARRHDRQQALASTAPGFTAITGDVTDEQATNRAVSEAIKQNGAIDTIILNAGIYTPQDSSSIDTPAYRQHMEVNYMGVVHGLAAALPAMVERGRGRVVIIASVAGWRGLPRAAAYGPTKAALISLATSLRFDLEPKGITVQVISPGFVDTEATAVNDFTMPQLMTIDAAATEIIAGMQTSRFEISFPRRFALTMRLISLLPWSLYFRLVGMRTGAK